MDEENKTNDSANSTSGSSGKMNPMVIAGVVLVVAVIGYFAMTMMGDKTQDSLEVVESMDKGDKIEASSGSGSDVMTESDATVVKVEGASFYYKPNVIKAKLGETVKVELTSVSMQHDFVIDELGVKSAVIPSGQKTTVQFVADTIGEFEFYCSVGNHRQQGMVGTLVVEQ